MTSEALQPETHRRIRRLPEVLVNQIAAGEVVERPASVVKELVENALDAGAARIDILLTDGGRQEVAVLDDGHGMEGEDLRLSIERHATSKIQSQSDLERIASFGFRGEALSSIASVSDFTLRSRTREMSHALVLQVAYGEMAGDCRPLGAPVGTGVFVRRLFERVPARLKFLRTVGTEFSHCSRVVRELALGNPAVSFHLQHQGRPVSQYLTGDRASRFGECFRVDWAPLHLIAETDGVRLEAYVSPANLPQDRGELFLFVNQRPIRNRSLLGAIRAAYLEALGPRHDPSGVVYLDIRPDWLDVNVHPQKTEVRLLHQERLYPWLVSTLRKGIALAQGGRGLGVAEPAGRYPTRFKATMPEQLPAVPQSPFRFLAQIRDKYLVCEDTVGLLLVDQHALHEKLRFEEISAQLASAKPVTTVPLEPRVVRLPTELIPVLERNLSLFCRIGFELEPFGASDVVVKGRPSVLQDTKTETVLVESLRAAEKADDPMQALIATLVCHTVVGRCQRLSPAEANELLAGCERLDESWKCPHGRAVLLRLPATEIEKHFERS